MRGSWRAKTRKAEPVPVSQQLTCPSWLDADGKKVWKALVKHLKAMQVVGAVDVFAVGRYCQLFTRWLEAEKDIRTNGARLPHLSPDGDVLGYYLSPSVKIAGDLADKLLRLETHYGMTASARASLSVVPEKPGAKDAGTGDKSRFFKQRA